MPTEQEQIQIYLSYAPDDDGVPPGAPSTSGFVTALAGYLEYAFQFHGYPRPSTWRARREEDETTDLDPNTKDAIDASSLMLILFSRNWVHRLRCCKELEYFMSRWRSNGESVRHRIIVARKNYVEEKEYPALFATGSIPRDTGFDFFKFDGRLEPGNERLYFDPQRESQTSDYAQIASELGRSLWLRARDCLRTDRPQVVTNATPLAQQASQGGYTIYLAKPGPDMLKEYRRIARELCERGFNIIPREDQEIPTDQSAPTFIDEALKGANISVHLIGADYGYAPTNSDRIVGLQLARSAARMVGQNKSADDFHRIDLGRPDSLPIWSFVTASTTLLHFVWTATNSSKATTSVTLMTFCATTSGRRPGRTTFVLRRLCLRRTTSRGKRRFMFTIPRKTPSSPRTSLSRYKNSTRTSSQFCLPCRVPHLKSSAFIANGLSNATQSFCVGPMRLRSGCELIRTSSRTGERLVGPSALIFEV